MGSPGPRQNTISREKQDTFAVSLVFQCNGFCTFAPGSRARQLHFPTRPADNAILPSFLDEPEIDPNLAEFRPEKPISREKTVHFPGFTSLSMQHVLHFCTGVAHPATGRSRSLHSVFGYHQRVSLFTDGQLDECGDC